MINIAGLTPVEDPSYRYKMPRIQAKVEGRGNGIKTVLVNVGDLGTALNRDAPEITKFFGCEIGSQTSYSADTERAIVNGAHNAPDLQNHLSKYIENFVLCKNCRYPETHYKIKGGIIYQKCLACGSKDSCDMQHKLTTFILAQYKKAKDADGKKDKKEKKKNKAADAEAEDESKPSASEKSEKKSKKKEKEKAAAAAATAEAATTEEECSEKKSSKKKRAKDEQESSGDDHDDAGDADADDDGDNLAADDAIDRFRLWRADNADAPASVAAEELRIMQTFAGLRVVDRVIIFAGATFSESLVTANEVAANKEMLSILAPNPIQQRHLISCMEWFCGTRIPALKKFFPVVLKQLYEEELVEEETFLAWAGDICRNEHTAEASMITLEVLEELRAAAAPFITWLQEAEEDDDEEDDEDDA